MPTPADRPGTPTLVATATNRLRAARGRLQHLGHRIVTRASRYTPGLLSVVVPAYGVEDYIGECLDSLRAQEYTHIEIIVVDDGSPDRSGDIARAHAAQDPRIRVVRRENGGLSAARNTGIEHARGEFLVFIDSDDTVSPKAFSLAIEALAESGSDFAVTNYDRLQKDGRRTPALSWIQQAHAQRRLGATLTDFPEVMVNAVAWSKVYRRRFWDETGLSFPIGKLYEDQAVSMAAYAHARAFDVLPNIGVHWRVRSDGSSISQAAATARNLADHNDAVRDSLTVLRETGHARAEKIRALQVLANNMPYFIRHLSTADDDFWLALREGLATLVDSVSRETYVTEVPALDKVVVDLIRADERERATTVLEETGRDMRRLPTVLQADGLHVALQETEGALSDSTRLADREIALKHRLYDVDWRPDGSLRLSGWTYLTNVDFAAHAPSIQVSVVGEGGSRRPLEVSTHVDARAEASGGHHWADYSRGGFEAVLPADAVPTDPGSHAFELSVSAAGVRRTEVICNVAPAGSAGLAQTRILPGGRAAVVTPRRPKRNSPSEPVRMSVRQYGAWARSVAYDADRLVLELEAQDEVRAVQIAHIDRDEPFLRFVPTAVGERRWQVAVDLSELPDFDALLPEERQRPLRFRAVTPAGTQPVLATPDLPVSPGVPVLSHRVVSRARTGEMEILDWLPVVTHYAISDDNLSITVQHRLALPGAPALRGSGDEVFATTSSERGSTLLQFPLTISRWGRSGLALRSGKYDVGFVTADGLVVAATPSDALIKQFPDDRVLARYRSRARVTPTVPPSFSIALDPPLADDERGNRHQRRLREESRVDVADADTVFFRTLYGEVTNCNALAVHQELRSRGSALTLLWSIKDRSVPVPDGGVGLVEGTREWHRALARTRYQMVNVHQLDWFTKPKDQVLIQTMHGYPYKVMGHDWWAKGRFSARQVRSYDRRAREWDYFVSPASYATPLLRAAFLEPAGAEPEVLEIGYPRNDILLSAEGEKVREQTRALLGLAPDQTAVLYAPTFRDYLSADDMTAKKVDFFDVDRVRTQLGDDVVILVRGHAFHSRARGGRNGYAPGVIDVTDHPDINELMLASDAAVLDYSSVRFDYALTDKPMIFLIPDLERYDAHRGGVIPYAPTAPGPHARTTDEVIAALRELPRITAEYAEARARFRRDYTDLEDGHAAARLVDAVFVPRGDSPG